MTTETKQKQCVNCGKVRTLTYDTRLCHECDQVERAEMVTLDAEHLEPRSLGGICPKCFVIAQAEGRTYEAGLVSGQEICTGE